MGHTRLAAAIRARATARGNPEATREAILRIVDAEEPPLRIFFGDGLRSRGRRCCDGSVDGEDDLATRAPFVHLAQGVAHMIQGVHRSDPR